MALQPQLETRRGNRNKKNIVQRCIVFDLVIDGLLSQQGPIRSTTNSQTAFVICNDRFSQHDFDNLFRKINSFERNLVWRLCCTTPIGSQPHEHHRYFHLSQLHQSLFWNSLPILELTATAAAELTLTVSAVRTTTDSVLLATVQEDAFFHAPTPLEPQHWILMYRRWQNPCSRACHA